MLENIYNSLKAKYQGNEMALTIISMAEQSTSQSRIELKTLVRELEMYFDEGLL